MHTELGSLDYAILLIYVGFVIGIGFALTRYMKTSSDFLTSGRSIPAWVTGLAFISANLGALELVGMAASGAKYGIATAHFYWVGAIPAMIFLAVFMMPFYYGSKARSVPEYLKMRFDERVRALNSISFAVMTLFASGISMNALAKLLHQLLGWNYDASLWICSAVVLLYVLKGGLTSAIYTEVLQFFMIVLGFAPVVYLGLKDVGGWDALKGKLVEVAANPAAAGMIDKAGKVFPADSWTSAWKPLLAGPTSNPMGVDWFAMVFGLGFVLSFGYWCTNFLVVQRAMAAKNMSAARRTPLIAAVPKMIFPVLVILPGMIAAALAVTHKDGYRLPPKPLDAAIYQKMVPAVNQASAAYKNANEAVVAVLTSLSPDDLNTFKFNSEKISAIVADNRSAPLSAETLKVRLQDAVGETDYDGVILSLVKKYCPTGLLGLALDRSAGLVHVRHGRQRDCLQHHLDLRPLPGLPRAEQERCTLCVDGPLHYRRRHCVEHRLRLFGQPLVQRHGHHPTGVWLCECAALCDLPARHVLEAHDRHRRISGIAGRHGHLRSFPCAVNCVRQRSRHQGRLPLDCDA